MEPSARTTDPVFAGAFFVTVGGVEIGAFTEVSGLGLEIEVEELPEGGQNQFVHKLPGRMKWSNIVLKSGVTDGQALFDWVQKSSGDGFAGEGNSLARQNGAISVYDPAGEVVRQWNFIEAFPVRWAGPTMAASSSELAVEELEIAHHGFTAAS